LNDITKNKERFLSLCSNVHRDGFDEFLADLERTDFFVCPASAKYHGAYPGGLLEHSLNVYDEMIRLRPPPVHLRPTTLLISLTSA